MDIILLDKQNNILDQFNTSNTLGFSSEEVINGVGKGSVIFSIEKSNELFEKLQVKNRLIIRENQNIIFGGEIFGVKPSYDVSNTFYLQDLLGVFQNRIIHEAKNYNGLTIKAALEQLFTYLNNIEPLNIDLECNILDIISGGEYAKKTSIFAIIEDLLKNKYEYRVKPKINGLNVSFVFEVQVLLGEDRSTGNNYKEFKLDLARPKKRTIETLEADLDINYTANVVLGEQNNNFTTKIDQPSIDLLGRIERGVSFNNNLEEETQQYLDDRNTLYKGISIFPKEQDYFSVNLGDKVKIIAKGNKFLEFDEGIRVTAKKYTFGDLPKVSFTFNVSKVTKSIGLDLFVDEINTLKSKVQNL